MRLWASAAAKMKLISAVSILVIPHPLFQRADGEARDDDEATHEDSPCFEGHATFLMLGSKPCMVCVLR